MFILIYLSEKTKPTTPGPRKILGEWKPEGDCIPNISGSSCGPGTQIMKRECEDGAVQKCEYDDTISGRKCSLGDCPKLLGDWTDQDVCKPFNALKRCGAGTKTQKRS